MRAMVTSKTERNVALGIQPGWFAWMIMATLAVLFTSSCGGSLFKVKPMASLPPMPDNAASVNLSSLSFRAAPMLTDEESQEIGRAHV